MGSPVLLLRLEGPLQSWGGRSRWDVRDTQSEPTKSGVIGLLGCALGLERGDPRLEELERSLRFGVRIEAPGRVLEDYQTITDFLPTADKRYKHSGIAVGSSLDKLRNSPDAEPSTVLSPRYYLEDASFLVGLEPRLQHRFSLDAIAASLQNPRWTLFLGRKACIPTRPIFEECTDRYEGLEDALQKHPWSWLGGGAEQRNAKPQKLVAYVEHQDGDYRRQDALRVNPLRQYGFINLRRIAIQGVS